MGCMCGAVPFWTVGGARAIISHKIQSLMLALEAKQDESCAKW